MFRNCGLVREKRGGNGASDPWLGPSGILYVRPRDSAVIKLYMCASLST